MAARRKPVAAYHGGHDFDFVGEVADRYNCQICTKVIREPHLAVCCGQHFCESCLNKWFARQRGKQSCPHCRAEGEAFNHVINKGLRSEVNQLKIRCSNSTKGCEWTGELGQLDAHLSGDGGCGFVVVECPNKCGHPNLFRMAVLKHVDKECGLRPYKCEYCDEKGTYQSITGRSRSTWWQFWQDHPRVRDHPRARGHQAICPEFPLTCPNKCGSDLIKRKDMDGHCSKCPQQAVECPFAEAGCKNKHLRCELDAHVSSNQQQHLLLLMKDYGDTKKRLLEMEGKFTTALQLLRQGKDADEQIVDFFITCSTTLKQYGDSVQLVMPKFSEYRRSGKVWHSPPFYVREGYKMCLAVYANGVGAGADTHVSVSLLLLKGTYDGQLKWPMQSESCKGFLYNIHLPSSYLTIDKLEGRHKFTACSPKCHRVISEHAQVDHVDYFCALDCKALRLINDCLTLVVRFRNCFLSVSIV